jgi:beta-glucosidase-like glycosyl hydrolase
MQLWRKILVSNLLICGLAHAGKYTQELRSNELKIPAVECSDIESQVGQLLYINVDGNGYNGEGAIHPEYVKLVKELQIGGVLPHFNYKNQYNQDSQYVPKAHIIKSTTQLQNSSKEPLFIGADYIWTDAAAAKDKSFLFGYIGLGYQRGTLTTERSDRCLSLKGKLEGLIHKVLGINQALGPTVDITKRLKDKDADLLSHKANILGENYQSMNIALVLKHFPYEPDDFNLHKKIDDATISEEDLKNRLRPFAALKNLTPFAMTTHTFNSNIDSKNVATFSKEWIQRLRKIMGEDKIVITDALYMIKDSGEEEILQSMYEEWKHENSDINDKYSIFAIRAILAGHDMAFLEGTAAQTRTVFKNMLKFACSNSKSAPEFRARIKESYAKIVKFKRQDQKQLTNIVPISDEDWRAILELHDKIRPSLDPKEDHSKDCDTGKYEKEAEEIMRKIKKAKQDPQEIEQVFPNESVPGT